MKRVACHSIEWRLLILAFGTATNLPVPGPVRKKYLKKKEKEKMTWLQVATTLSRKRWNLV